MIIDWIIDHNIGISKYNPLVGRRYIKLAKELEHPYKRLINTQNINDNECFKCLVRYLNPEDHNPARIKKADKDFIRNLDLKDIKFPVKMRDIHNIDKKNSIGISAFGYENKEKHPIYVSKKCYEEKHFDLLLIEEKGKRYFVLTKGFIKFMYNHIFHRRKNIFVVIVYRRNIKMWYERLLLN